MKLYQNLPGFDEVDPKRRKSEYWNVGKWKNFINPLLPKDCKNMTFIDMGCNAGLFLKMAKDKGFGKCIGIEKSRSTLKEGEKYRKKTGYDYQLLNQTMGVDFNLDRMPVADVTLLANVHYYMKVGDFLEYLDKLRRKTLYCIVVTSNHKSPSHHWRPSGMIPDVRNYFKEWIEEDAIYRVKYNSRLLNDPAPRKLWSLRFKSQLKRVKIDDLKWGASGHSSGKHLLRDELAEIVLQRGKYDRTYFDLRDSEHIKKTRYFRTWVSRDWTEDRALDFTIERLNTMLDVSLNGMKKPIWIQLDNKIIDGGHRVSIMKALGYKYIIGRVI